MPEYDEDQIKDIQARLNALGNDWQATVKEWPEVRAYDTAHGRMRAAIELDGPRASNVRMNRHEPYAIFYRNEANGKWWSIGWSSAGRSMLGREITADGIFPRLRAQEKLAGAEAMFAAAASNPDLDLDFADDLYDYLHGAGDDPEDD